MNQSSLLTTFCGSALRRPPAFPCQHVRLSISCKCFKNKKEKEKTDPTFLIFACFFLNTQFRGIQEYSLWLRPKSDHSPSCLCSMPQFVSVGNKLTETHKNILSIKLLVIPNHWAAAHQRSSGDPQKMMPSDNIQKNWKREWLSWYLCATFFNYCQYISFLFNQTGLGLIPNMKFSVIQCDYTESTRSSITYTFSFCVVKHYGIFQIFIRMCSVQCFYGCKYILEQNELRLRSNININKFRYTNKHFLFYLAQEISSVTRFHQSRLKA